MNHPRPRKIVIRELVFLLLGVQGKYVVSRHLEAAPTELKQMPLLKAA
jgi:hypothetical protein